MFVIYTDGSCRGNPGSGGFGVIVTENDKIINAYSHFEEKTTNNREEMKAIIWALYNYGHLNPIVYSDSSYSINTFTNWMWKWKQNNWIKSDKKTPENLDLIKLFDMIKNTGKDIDLRYVKGHAGIKYNEMADQLATGKIGSMEVIYG